MKKQKYVKPTLGQSQPVLIDMLLTDNQKQIYTTVGVYRNGDRITNRVLREDVFSHISYNLTFRPGRAFFLEGICLNRGYFSIDEIFCLEQELSSVDDSLSPASKIYR